MKLWKEYSDDEIKDSKKWARTNYKPFSPISGVWHWVIQQECVQINKEAGGRVEEHLK